MLTTFSFKEQSPKGSSFRSDTTVKCTLAIDARSTLKKEREKERGQLGLRVNVCLFQLTFFSFSDRQNKQRTVTDITMVVVVAAVVVMLLAFISVDEDDDVLIV